MSEFDKYIVQGEPDKRHHGSCKSTTYVFRTKVGH